MPRNRSPLIRLGTALAVPFALAVPAALAILAVPPPGAAAAVPDGPELTASRSADLTSGAEITVTGSGFTPKTILFVALCDTAQPPGKACDTGNFARVTTDADGGLETTMTPEAVFGSTDCTATTCALMTNDPANPRDTANFARLAVTFAAPATPAPGSAPPATPAQGPAASAVPSAGAAAPDEAGGLSAGLVAVIAVVLLVLGVAALLAVRRRARRHS
ncbi:neocarzinostatin apoprotein domain-containing protein [Microtetraspora niveoalba]|uniref:neocarzinostatin apoprotein domain-containing protein n=1 Tax=Microtetraspora niveoalba TaxID=46175 RepID=UPI00082F5B4A|nr:neocarzinostatin apoprotein domain-containing protein [Microtetraspora niveoalba]